MPAPPEAVLVAFAASAPPERLAGGQGLAWRAGDVVFKPLDMPLEALRWQSDVLGALDIAGLRLAVPLRSRDGDLVVDGWTAWPYLPGAHLPRWEEILAVSERFHRAVAGVERPTSILDARDDVWARADRIAWGEQPPGDFGVVQEVAHLLALRAEVEAPSQLIHGDLSGNVLFADGLPPAVIDLSPYWRPAEYASAIVAVDAVLWHSADLGLLGTAASAQLVIRALLFRLLATADPAGAAAGYRAAIAFVEGVRG